MHNPITKLIRPSTVALQYADDIVIITSEDLQTYYSKFSPKLGLAINPAKSSFAPFNLTEQQRHVAAIIIGYKMQSLPIIYLGMPLTATKPSKELFIPLVEKIERRLQKWQRKLISEGGRSQLHGSFSSLDSPYLLHDVFSASQVGN
jgi:hypothetical protein